MVAKMKVVWIGDPTGAPAVTPGRLNDDNSIRSVYRKLAEEESIGESEYGSDRPGAKSRVSRAAIVKAGLRRIPRAA
jgi:hypothetical protein